jgi:hypothetical protein
MGWTRRQRGSSDSRVFPLARGDPYSSLARPLKSGVDLPSLKQGGKMKLSILCFIAACLISSASFAQSFQNSPYNFQNSPYNFQNSPYNFQNSPYNFQNSPYNFNSTNGVYDNSGNRMGYAVPRSDGSGVNIFDNNGNRMGYQNYGQ